jgi:small GTP-binding protein
MWSVPVRRKAKVCLIGATAVGKSSLVARYVRSIFSDEYRTTIGVKIETCTLARPQGVIDLVIWDLSGEDEFQNVQPIYLRGARAYMLVVDGTRRETALTAAALQARVSAAIGPVPFVVVINKADLRPLWELRPSDYARIEENGWRILEASAKTGVGVKESFEILADAVLRGGPWT